MDIEITGHDRHGLLNEVLQAVSESKTNISAVSGRSDKNKMAMIHMTILIRNIDHLQSVVEKIKRVKDVYTVTPYYAIKTVLERVQGNEGSRSTK